MILARSLAAGPLRLFCTTAGDTSHPRFFLRLWRRGSHRGHGGHREMQRRASHRSVGDRPLLPVPAFAGPIIHDQLSVRPRVTLKTGLRGRYTKVQPGYSQGGAKVRSTYSEGEAWVSAGSFQGCRNRAESRQTTSLPRRFVHSGCQTAPAEIHRSPVRRSNHASVIDTYADAGRFAIFSVFP